jgi:quercetin dioxygenase-like cupin family protein
MMETAMDRGERQAPVRLGVWAAPGEDRSGEHYLVGTGVLSYKVLADDSQGSLVAIEEVLDDRGGPPRHLHRYQDELFYVLEGQFHFEIGGERFLLEPGGSAFGPRGVPHGWAFVGEGTGRILFVFTPAGRMEACFREVGRRNAVAPQDPGFWPPFELELMGPPLDLPSPVER